MRLGIACIFFFSTIVFAGTSGIQSIGSSAFRPIVAVLGGYANVQVGGSGSYVGTGENIFTYINNEEGKSTGFIGVFLGLEHPLSYRNLIIQGGLEYDYFARVNAGGYNTVGIEPGTSTLYSYGYHFQPQQLMAVAKLLATYRRVHPYVAGGIGASWNSAADYQAITEETGSINLTPMFNNKNHSALSYSVGAGLETDITQKFRLGLGYRFSYFGSASLGDGQVVFNNYAAAVPFTINAGRIYANQSIAQISYLA